MSEQSHGDSEQERLARVQAVKRTHEEALMARANVVGVGVGLVRRRGAATGDVGIVVMVSRKVPASQLAAADLVPRELEGVPVDVQAVGEIRAHS
ncbi:MAG TPA: hypothetical protein VK879_18940 [Candidatus Sulfomarinibacteraceae bacterium]|nr:hypothetical protein [Candidatus Sulfomarinibacteraceae bacterium]